MMMFSGTKALARSDAFHLIKSWGLLSDQNVKVKFSLAKTLKLKQNLSDEYLEKKNYFQRCAIQTAILIRDDLIKNGYVSVFDLQDFDYTFKKIEEVENKDFELANQRKFNLLSEKSETHMLSRADFKLINAILVLIFRDDIPKLWVS